MIMNLKFFHDIASKTFFRDNWSVVGCLSEDYLTATYEMARLDMPRLKHTTMKAIEIMRDPAADISGNANAWETMLSSALEEIHILYQNKGNPYIIDYFDHAELNITNASGTIVGCHLLIRMELLPSLDQKISLEGCLTESEIVRLGTDILNGLKICHDKGIMHRDIKIENIFVSSRNYKLGNFGVIKFFEDINRVRIIYCSCENVAPEICNGENYSFASDIYSLGLVLYTLLNKNQYPFVSTDASCIDYSGIRRRRLRGEPLHKLPTRSAALSKVILKACEFNPEHRYQNAGEMLDDLLAVTE